MKSRKKNRRTLRGKVRILARILRDGAGSAMDARGRVMQVVRIFPGIFFYDRPCGCQALHPWGEISLRGRDMVSDKQGTTVPVFASPPCAAHAAQPLIYDMPTSTRCTYRLIQAVPRALSVVYE